MHLLRLFATYQCDGKMHNVILIVMSESEKSTIVANGGRIDEYIAAFVFICGLSFPPVTSPGNVLEEIKRASLCCLV